MEESVSAVEYEGQKYSLVVVPGLNTQVVIAQTEEINRSLQLDQLAYDFKSLGLFLRLAHYGVVGHVDLQIAVGKTLYSAVTICDDTVHLVHEFERASQKALDNMQAAYEYLEEDLEEDAIETLQQVIFTAQKMQNDADELSKRCEHESATLLEVQENTLLKGDEVNKQITKANENLNMQKSEHKINEELISEEEAAAVKNDTEIKTAIKNKDVVLKTKEEYIEEEKQKMMELNLEKQELTQQLQSKLEKEVNDIRISLKKTLQQNETEYRESLAHNDEIIKTMLQENKETLQRQQRTILDERQRSEDTSKADYDVMLQSKFEEVENKLKDEFSLQYDKEYQLKLEKLEKEYEDKDAMYERQYKRQVEENDRLLKIQIGRHKNDFDKIIKGIDTPCSSKAQDIDHKYGNPTKLSEKDLQDKITHLEETCSDQITKNKEQYESAINQINTKFNNAEQQLEEEFEDLKKSLENKDKTEYEELQKLCSKPIEKPTEASLGAYKTVKCFLFGNQEDISARDKKLAEAEAMERKIQLAKENREKNIKFRNEQLTKATNDFIGKKRHNKEDKDNKIKRAESEEKEQNARAISERDSKIKDAKRQKVMFDDLQKAELKLSEDIQTAESSINEKNNKAYSEKCDKCRKVLDDKKQAIKMMKISHIDALKLKVQNEASVQKSQAIERARVKWECEIKDMEQNKVKADARVHAEKTKNDETSLAMKRQHDEEAVKNADELESKLKSEYKLKLEKIEQTIHSKETNIKEYFKKKHENTEKKYDELKQLEELYRKKQEEHEKQRQIAKIKMAEAAQKIASFQDEVEVNKSSQYCLQQAVRALREIQGIIINTSNFWRETASVCKTVTEHNFTQKVSKISDRTESSREALWKSKTFKKQALQYYGKWVALKHVCINAENQLSFAKDDVHKYLRETPNAEEAKRLVSEIADQLRDHLAIEDVPSHKK